MGIIQKGKLILRRKTRNFLGMDAIDLLFDRMAVITDIYMPASLHHREVFPKYKNINKGQTMIIVGSGPTLDYYTPIPGAIHIAINYAIRRKDIKFDYCFTSDYDAKDGSEFMDELMAYGDDFVSFLGINYRRVKALMPEFVRERSNVEWYYVDSYNWLFGEDFDNAAKLFFPLDISISPLKSYGTTMFCALQFALWTHPDKICLVGADCCGRNHANAIGYTEVDNKSDLSYIIPAWKKAKEFVAACYPDIKIESINPVGLQGVFEDKFTDEYVKRGMEV